MNIKVGSLSLSLSEQATSVGSYYWRFACEGAAHDRNGFAVWSSELGWFVNSLRQVSRPELVNRFLAPGLYPLAANMSANGGLCWFVQVGDRGTHLVLRRFTASFVPKEAIEVGRKDIAYTTFFHFQRFGGYPVQVRIPITTVGSGDLAKFGESAGESYAGFCSTLTTDLGIPVPNGCSVSDLFQRVTVRCRIGSKFRQVPLEPGLLSLVSPQFAVLDGTVLAACLRHCAALSSASQVSQLLENELDPAAIKNILMWPRRYDTAVLQDGYFFCIGTKDSQEAYLAVRDKSLFASDPLLTSLLEQDIPIIETHVRQPLPIPQFPMSLPDKARISRWIAGEICTAWGTASLPTPERADATRRMATPTKSLMRFRWKVLQIADLLSAIARNAASNDSRQVLLLQCVALLCYDLKILFSEDARAPDLDAFVAAIRARYWNSIRGVEEPCAMTAPSELPHG